MAQRKAQKAQARNRRVKNKGRMGIAAPVEKRALTIEEVIALTGAKFTKR